MTLISERTFECLYSIVYSLMIKLSLSLSSLLSWLLSILLRLLASIRDVIICFISRLILIYLRIYSTANDLVG